MPAATGGATTYEDAVAKLAANLAQKNTELATAQAEVAAAQAAMNAEIEKSAAQKKAFDEEVAKMQTTFDQSLADARASYAELTASFEKQTKEVDVVKTQAKESIAAAKQETADYKETATQFAEINAGLADRIDQLSNAEFERADAQVVYADQANKVVRLNVGTDDGVRPLTTFNVFPADAIDVGGAKPKGSVQVVKALGPHECEARILEDEIASPIMSGDLVYTPLWRPGETVRYALDFNLDVNGDGRSDLDEIIGLIQAAGGEVAAYLDADGKEVGSIDSGVYRLVVSEREILDVLKTDFSLDQATKDQIVQTRENFLDAAARNGVRTMTLSDFLVRVGYKKAAQVTRFKEEGGISTLENGTPATTVSDSPVAPIYTGTDEPAPRSPGIVAPTFVPGAEPAPVSEGKTSDYFFRQRAPKGN
ncbi:MAG: hypothetical protein IJO46_13240 [Thermoguttaceae bacterium]|nr:hypothetical protein [Thermoguttaceae bacterium]